MSPVESEQQVHLERAARCYAARAWADARDAFAAADALGPLGSPDLERWAWSCGLSGADETLIGLGERLYRELGDAGDGMRAALWAFWTGFRLFPMGEHARANGWIARAARLVERDGNDCAMRGYLLLPVARKHYAAREFEQAATAAGTAAEIGERFADPDLVAFARSLQSQTLLRRGRIAEGLALFDEVMLAVTGGDLSPIMTGLIYCSAIGGCRTVYALDRAREWTAALAAWCDAQPQLAPFNGACRVHRAEVLQLGGAWTEAIDEARRAGQVASVFEQAAVAEALYQQAEIHRLRGDFELADETYREASERGRDPQPGLALLRVAQGNPGAAAAAIRRAVGSAAEPLERARLLPASVEIALAVGDLDEARGGCEELEGIATKLDLPIVGVMAAHARGAVRLAEGDAQGAVEPLRRAFAAWQALGAPYLAARIRVALGRACRVLGDDEGAELEFAAARAVFERLGAAPDLASLETLRSGATANDAGDPGTGLSARELQVLRLVATGRTNKAIARELFLSGKTVDRHLSNIFAKLGVATRSAATAYAYEHGLV